MSYSYRGIDSKILYTFLSPLIDAEGHAVVGGQYSTATYNFETVIYANRDGSVQMPTAGPSIQKPSSQADIGPISLNTVTPSPWEMAVPNPTQFAVRSSGAGPIILQQDPSGWTPNQGFSGWSLEMWFLTTATALQGLWSEGVSSSDISGHYVTMNSTGHVVVKRSGSGADTTTTPHSYNDGHWHQLVISDIGGPFTPINLYADGALAVNNVPGIDTAPNRGQLTIGGLNNNTDPFNGSIAYVSFYNRALTAQQVANHYAGRLKYYAASVLADTPYAFWQLQEPAGATSAVDSSGNNFNIPYQSSGITVGQKGPFG